MKTHKIVVLIVFQLYFIYASCYELKSYDTPQEAMHAAETEIDFSDRTSKDILVIGKAFELFLNTIYMRWLSS